MMSVWAFCVISSPLVKNVFKKKKLFAKEIFKKELCIFEGPRQEKKIQGNNKSGGIFIIVFKRFDSRSV